jgi:hypothetical protein
VDGDGESRQSLVGTIRRFGDCKSVRTIRSAALSVAQESWTGLVFAETLPDGKALDLLQRANSLERFRCDLLGDAPSHRVALLLTNEPDLERLQQRLRIDNIVVATRRPTRQLVERFCRQALAAEFLNIVASAHVGAVADCYKLSAMETQAFALEVSGADPAIHHSVLEVARETLQTFRKRIRRKSSKAVRELARSVIADLLSCDSRNAMRRRR